MTRVLCKSCMAMGADSQGSNVGGMDDAHTYLKATSCRVWCTSVNIISPPSSCRSVAFCFTETLNANESRGFFHFSRVNIRRVTGSRWKQPVVRMHPFGRRLVVEEEDAEHSQPQTFSKEGHSIFVAWKRSVLFAAKMYFFAAKICIWNLEFLHTYSSW